MLDALICLYILIACICLVGLVAMHHAQPPSKPLPVFLVVGALLILAALWPFTVVWLWTGRV